jgi:DNA-binding GntR family transcriptional regulator
MHQTKADYAAVQIREALISGRFTAGERLQPRDLARELDLSLTPVREALIELAAEGLIEMRPHRGPHVASANVESLEELYLLRETLEGLAVQLAAERMTDEELLEVRRIHEQFVEQHAVHAAERLAELSDQFHMAIYAAAKAPMLLRLVKTVLAAAPSGILASIKGRADQSLTDHAELLAALQTRDAERAATVMRKHLHDTLVFVDEFQRRARVPDSAPEPQAEEGKAPPAKSPARTRAKKASLPAPRKRATKPPASEG